MGCADSNEEQVNLPLGTLHYFDIYGRGEQIRLMLDKKGVRYTDRRFTFEQWPEIKDQMPGKAVPAWEDRSGVMMNESLAILRYLGKKCGYYPSKDLEMAADCDAICDYINDEF